MAGLYRRGPRWWISYTDAGGKPVRRSLGPRVRTREQAEAARREVERLVGAGHIDLPALGTLADGVADFERDAEARLEPASVAYYRKHGRILLRSVPGATQLGAVSHERLAAYVAERRRATSAQTANKTIVYLRVLFGWLKVAKRLRDNPASDLRPFSARVAPRVSVTREALEAVYAALAAEAAGCDREDERRVRALYRDVLEVLWWTGMRLGEACAMRPGDVDVRARTVALRSAPNKGPRVLPLPAAVLPVLRQRLAEGRAWVFSTWDGACAYGALVTFGARFRRRHPELADVTPHALRHSYSDRTRLAGVDVIVRSRGLLGHSSVQMTARYSHEHLDEMRAAVEQLERFTRGGEGRPGRRGARHPRPRHRA